MELIRVHDLHKTYHLGEVDVPVLHGVSLSIRRGEMVALMGASGSGKTTLMNILGCLDHPTSGEYWLDGEEMSRLSANERAVVRSAKLGFVFQSFNLLSRTSALNNVLMPLDYSAHGLSLNQARKRAVELLKRVGLGQRLDHQPSQMSGGQQQRVAIARALINNPALVLADEPTGNLDSHTGVEILRMFQELNTMGITVLLVTHDPEVGAYAHRTIRMVDGLVAGEERTGGDGPVTLHTNGNPAGNGDGASLGGNGTVAVFVPTIVGAETIASTAHVSHPSRQLSTSVESPALPASTAASPAVTKPEVLVSSADGQSKAAELESPPEAGSTALLTAWMPATLRTAINSLRRNKMRSALTSLGIIIGIAAVISIVEIGQGSQAAIQRSMASMGANTVTIRSGVAATGGVTFGAGSILTLTPDDAEQIGLHCDSVIAVSPMVDVRAQVVYGGLNCVPMNIYGVTPDYLAVREWQELSSGDPFTESDVDNANRVCLLGETVAKTLFPDESPLGKEIRVRSVGLKVIGVLSPKGSNMMGRDQDDVVLAPWTTIKYRVAGKSAGNVNQSAETASGGSTSEKINTLNNLYPPATQLYTQRSAAQEANTPQPIRFITVDQIMVKAASAAEIKPAMTEISALLRQRHNLRPDEPDDFNLRDMTEFVQAQAKQANDMTSMLLIVALISLVVGGVGIMNIMLVSVTERTREIGLRMAVGARSYHVMRQFLIEAVMLCFFGGILGVLLGRLSAPIVHMIKQWPMEMSLPAVLGAFAVSVTIGVVFGFYPAWKASRLDPIEALRYE